MAKAYLIHLDVLVGTSNNFDFTKISEQRFVELGSLVMQLFNKSLTLERINKVTTPDFLTEFMLASQGAAPTAEELREAADATTTERAALLKVAQKSSYTRASIDRRHLTLVMQYRLTLFQCMQRNHAASGLAEVVPFDLSSTKTALTQHLEKGIGVLNQNQDDDRIVRFDTLATHLFMTTCLLLNLVEDSVYAAFIREYSCMLEKDRSQNYDGIGIIATTLAQMTSPCLDPLIQHDSEVLDNLRGRLDARISSSVDTKWQHHPKNKDLFCLKLPTEISPADLDSFKEKILADEAFLFPLTEMSARNDDSQRFLTVSIKAIKSKHSPSAVDDDGKSDSPQPSLT